MKTENEASRAKSMAYGLGLALLVLAATLFGGFYGDRLFGATTEDELHRRIKEYTEVLAATEEWGATQANTEKLVYASIEGMLQTLDPHSSFLAPRDYTEMQDRQKGTFYGLGILVTKRNERVTVITPLEGTPAARLGIRAGDIISDVDGTATDDLSLDEVVRRLKGPKGTSVNIKIIRVGIKDPIPMTIVRDAIPTNSISYVLMLRDDVGYIRIKDFTYTTVREFEEALGKLQKEGMKKLVLDLRMNPGGLLDAAVGIADHFVDKGDMIVYTKGRTSDANQQFVAPGKHAKLSIPVVVLINRGSASASEIVAGAIQDHDRGLVVGETSWGKGLVQSVYSLQYGAGLALTTSKYFTPAGRNIQRDYTSFYDYYVGDGSGAGVEEIPLSQREVFRTGTGRAVYGGGGITPDVIVKPRELSRVVQVLEVRSALFNFAVEYAAKHPDVGRNFKLTPEVVNEFARYAVENEIAPPSDVETALADPKDRQYIEQALRAEIVAAKYGYDASYSIRLQGDEQVARALAALPEAEKLAMSADDARAGKVARKRAAGGRGEAARAEPATP